MAQGGVPKWGAAGTLTIVRSADCGDAVSVRIFHASPDRTAGNKTGGRNSWGQPWGQQYQGPMMTAERGEPGRGWPRNAALPR